MSIPPSSPYPQSIQEILDEGRRNDEAAHNAPKPHPAQHMLDYHDQVARENNAYDYDPELTVQAQKQDATLVADAAKSVNQYETTNTPAGPSTIAMSSSDIRASSSIHAAVAKIAPRMRELQMQTGHEHSALIVLRRRFGSDPTFYPTDIVTNSKPDMVQPPHWLVSANEEPYADLHTEPTEDMSDRDYSIYNTKHDYWQFMISESGNIQFWEQSRSAESAKTVSISEFISTYGE